MRVVFTGIRISAISKIAWFGLAMLQGIILAAPVSAASSFSLADAPTWHQQWPENFYTNVTKTDSQGNVYQTGGYWDATDFDPTGGTDAHTLSGGTDFFVTKMNADGSYAWTRTVSAAGNEDGGALAIDKSGNIYVGGTFDGSNVDFDPGTGTDLHSSNGSTDAFVLKLNSNGVFQWAQTFGGSAGYDSVTALAVKDGNLFVGGGFIGTNVDLDPTAGTDLQTDHGNGDAFVMKLNTNGGFSWAGAIGGTRYDGVEDIAIDANDNAYIVGGVGGTNVDLDPSAGSNSLTTNGTFNDDGFITKVNSSGAQQWYGLLGGASDAELARGVAIGASGDVYIAGYYSGTIDMDIGAGTSSLTSAGGYATYAARYTSSGALVWAKKIVGPILSYHSFALDASENVYVGGTFSGTVNFNSEGSDSIASRGGGDVFITKFTSSGAYGQTVDIGSASASDDDYMDGLGTSGNDLFATIDVPSNTAIYVGSAETYTYGGTGYNMLLIKWGTAPTADNASQATNDSTTIAGSSSGTTTTKHTPSPLSVMTAAADNQETGNDDTVPEETSVAPKEEQTATSRTPSSQSSAKGSRNASSTLGTILKTAATIGGSAGFLFVLVKIFGTPRG